MTRPCDGCRFCCWTYGVPDMTTPLAHCEHECSAGCALHAQPTQPDPCRAFECPYVLDQPIHRPDAFQPLLERMHFDMTHFVPAIADSVPIPEACELIELTRTIMAGVLINGGWLRVVIPLDRLANGDWTTDSDIAQPWLDLEALHA